MNEEIQPTTLVPIPGDLVAAYRALAAHRHGGRVMPGRAELERDGEGAEDGRRLGAAGPPDLGETAARPIVKRPPSA
jgi:hypothetical protein